MPDAGLGYWDMLTDPRTRAAGRAEALAGLGGPGAAQQPGQGMPGMPPAPPQGMSIPPLPPTDIPAAFQSGITAAAGMPEGYKRGGRVRGYAGGGDVSDDDDDDGMTAGGAGLGSVSPMLLALTKRMMPGAGGGDDAPLTGEDKGLALAQAGFAMAAGNSPHALQNFGEGAQAGISSLMKLRQARALQRMKESMAMGTLGLNADKLAEAQRAHQATEAQKKADEDGRQARAAELAEIRRQGADAAAAARDAAKQAAADRADALAEQRYQMNSSKRLQDFNSTGVWRKLPGDEDHAVDGPPADAQAFTGPQVEDPSLPLKDRNKLKVAKPQQKQALSSIDETLGMTEDKVDALLKHPGLSKAVGFGGETISKVPGTEAADFAANLGTLKDTMFSQNIQAMRDASKTGGAVGSVSDKEGARFENMIASLSQSQTEGQFKENLNRVKDYTKFLRGMYKQKYNETYGEESPGIKTPVSTPNAGTPDDINSLINQFKSK